MSSNPRLFDNLINSLGSEPTFTTDITLRDLFAAATLAGAFANPTTHHTAAEIAKVCYAQADAMLAAREPKP